MNYNERKAAQMAAYLICKSGKSRMPHLKLMKLLYLAERESLKQHGACMFGDYLVSLPHGPVLSLTLDLMDGDTQSQPGGWEDFISAKENNELALKSPITIDSLDELSPADIEILDLIWGEFGPMGKWEIRNYTHKHCPEWQDPHGSSYPIQYEKLFEACGYSNDEAKELAEQIEEERRIDRLFAAL